MIIEGLCTTLNVDGSVNIAPMGPVVNEELTEFLFRPFQSSTTFQNLQRHRCGVFHVTDDVGLIARAAVGQLTDLPPLLDAQAISGKVIAGACRWFEFQVVEIDDSQPRSEMQVRVVHTGHLRDFWGLNRARHAILEVAILATRLHLLDKEDVLQKLKEYEVIVHKTAGESDSRTFEFLKAFIHDSV